MKHSLGSLFHVVLRSLVLALVVAVCAGAPAYAESEKEQIIRNWKELAAIQDRNQELFMRFGSPNFPDAADAEKWLTKLDEFLKTDLAATQKMLGETEKYGPTPTEVHNKWAEIAGDDDPFQRGRDVDGIIISIQQGLKSIEDGRRAAAQTMVEQAELQLANMDSFTEAVRPDIFQRNKATLELARRFDPGNQKAAEWLAKIDEMAAQSAAEAEKAMNEYVFPKHIDGFAGPGAPAELAKAAIEYINGSCKPNEKAVAAVVSEKDWYCFRRNIFGQPTIWALTFTVAIQLEEEKSKDITRVWSISFLTEEKPGVEKASFPPSEAACRPSGRPGGRLVLPAGWRAVPGEVCAGMRHTRSIPWMECFRRVSPQTTCVTGKRCAGHRCRKLRHMENDRWPINGNFFATAVSTRSASRPAPTLPRSRNWIPSSGRF